MSSAENAPNTAQFELELLAGFVTDNKRKRIEEVLQYRTYHITVVLEDIHQPQNASAVLRTCDCFGVQKIHIIENRNTYRINPDVTQGSEKWVDIARFGGKENNGRDCVEALKAQGYRIVATSPENNDCGIGSTPIDKKIALFFGREKEGLSREILRMADHTVKIPMYGFTQSFNLSVSAAIMLYALTAKMHASEVSWQMNGEEKDELRKKWYARIAGI